MFVGNDIVAYKHARCIGKWQNENFVNKVLTLLEQTQLQVQTNKDAYLWMLWTLKEAAYKLSCFLGNRNKFHAIQFEVRHGTIIQDQDIVTLHLPINNLSTIPIHQLCSTIKFGNNFFYGKTIITHDCIHSLVFDGEDMSNCLWGIDTHNNYNKNDYSKEVREFTYGNLKDQGIIIESIEKDNDGIPFVHYQSKEKYISLSHDQQFVSFAYYN
jgi:phosphopantetheinyl transferase (holo-ACP synthase)